MKKTNLKRLKKISQTSTTWINRQWKKSIKVNHYTLERKRRSYFFIILIYKGKTRTSFRTEVQAAGDLMCPYSTKNQKGIRDSFTILKPFCNFCRRLLRPLMWSALW